MNFALIRFHSKTIIMSDRSQEKNFKRINKLDKLILDFQDSQR